MDQITLIHNIQDALRSPATDAFFRTLNYVDTAWFFLILIPLMCLFFARDVAIRVIYGVLLSGISNMLLKMVFAVPRPFTIDPSVGLISVRGYSFPSGAGQSAFWMGGLIIWRFGGPLGWTLGILYWALLSFSRVYLGVHYPTDLVGGWVVGACVLWFLLSQKGLARFYPWATQRKALYLALGTLFFFLLPGNHSLFAAFFIGSHLWFFASEQKFQYNFFSKKEEKM